MVPPWPSNLPMPVTSPADPAAAPEGSTGIRRMARGRTDPHVANDLDGFMAAASRRLGEEGALHASVPLAVAGAWICRATGHGSAEGQPFK